MTLKRSSGKRTRSKRAGPRVRRYPRGWAQWIRTPADEAAVEAGARWDGQAAERVRDFLRRFCRHSKGEWVGRPFELQRWQWRDVVGPLYGWKRADGTRRFRNAYVEVPKKNGKSTLAAGLVLYALIADGEPGAEVYSAAADREQAGIVYAEAASMVRQSPALAARAIVADSRKRITWPLSRSWYACLSADVPTKEGLNVHFLCFDELHAQRTRALWDVLRFGGAARRQPISFIITTAGSDRHSICWEQHQHAAAVLAGDVTDPDLLAVIYAAPPGADFRRRATWRKANPSIGTIVRVDEMASAAAEAARSPTALNAFLRYRLDVWTDSTVAWLDMERWRAAAADFTPADLDGRRCFAGLDLASVRDLAALALVFPPDDPTGPYRVLWQCWAPRDGAADRERVDRVPYMTWARAGWLTLTEGNCTDFNAIREAVRAAGERYDIVELAIDRWNATQLMTDLAADGFDVIAHGQGYASMSGPAKATERLLLQGRLVHRGNPLAMWTASNTVVETDAAANVKPSKKKSTERIDPMIALVMAVGRAVATGSPYDDDDHDVLIL